MKIIKNTISVLLIIAIFGFLIFNDQITDYINANYIKIKSDDIYLEKNEYAKEENYKFVKITNDFNASNFQELLNIFYTALDSGTNEFTFYCDKKYEKCLDDINKIIPSDKQNDIMAELNNFVHPYNAYKNITLITNDIGKITIKFDKLYTPEMITEINTYIDNFINENITDEVSDYDKILKFHDYIINNTSYDIERANDINSDLYNDSPSHTAYGVIKNNIALCGGYSDIMAIYLNKLNIQNMKVAADLHVWNLVYFDSKWLNLDVTWDDPVTNTGLELLIHEYFLIDKTKLFELDSVEHVFKEEIYLEAK